GIPGGAVRDAGVGRVHDIGVGRVCDVSVDGVRVDRVTAAGRPVLWGGCVRVGWQVRAVVDIAGGGGALGLLGAAGRGTGAGGGGAAGFGAGRAGAGFGSCRLGGGPAGAGGAVV